MPSVTFIKRDGSEVTVEATAELSVMEIGRDNNLGIEEHAAAVYPVPPVM